MTGKIAEFITMTTSIIEKLCIHSWNLLQPGVIPRRSTKEPKVQTYHDTDTVSLGDIIRSPLAPPPTVDAPTELRLNTEDRRR